MSFCSLLEANARIVTEERGLQDICQAMDTHQDICDVMEAACSAIWSLSMEGLKELIYLNVFDLNGFVFSFKSISRDTSQSLTCLLYTSDAPTIYSV